MDKVQGTGH